MSNPFEEFGGIADTDLYKTEAPKANVNSNENSDPFAEFGGFSDNSINGTVQPNVVTQTSVTSQPKPIPMVAQSPFNIEPAKQPVYANNGVVQGGTSKSSYLDAKGKLHFEDEDDSNFSGFEKLKRNVKARINNFGNSRMLSASEKHPYVSSFVHGVGNDAIVLPQIVNTLANIRKSEAEKEQARIVNAKIRDNWNRTMDYDKPRTTGQKIANLAGEMLPLSSNMQSLANKATPAILSTANKIPIISNMITKYPKLSKFMASLPPAMLEGAGWGVADKGIRDIQGIKTEGSYKDSALTGALVMGGLHGATHALPAVASKVANTKPIKAVRNAYNGLLNSETPLGNTIANIQGTLADILGLDAVNETARKYQKLNRNISRGNMALEKRFSKADVDEVNNATGLSEEQEKLIFDRLKNGDPKKSTTTKDQEEAKEFFDNLLKEEKVSEHAEGDLRHVKSEIDVVNPKQEETPLKNDASHVSDDAERYKIKISNDNVSEDNFFKKRTKPITREEALANASKNAGHPVTEFVPDEHAPQIKRSAYGGRVHIEKDGKPWFAYSKKKKLPGGSAEGSDAGNWYEQKVKPKTKSSEADDAYIKPYKSEGYIAEAQGRNYKSYVNENYVRNNLEPEDTSSLQKEIEQAIKNIKPTSTEEFFKLRYNHGAKALINQTAKEKFHVSCFLNSAKSSKLAETLANPNYKGIVESFVNDLCNMLPSEQTKRALDVLYHNAPENIQKFIQNKITENKLPFKISEHLDKPKFTKQHINKGYTDKQITKTDGYEPLFIPKMKTGEAKYDGTKRIRPYTGDAPAGNADGRDSKTWREAYLGDVETNKKGASSKIYNLDELFNREKYTKIELKKDAIWNEKFRDYRVHRRKQEFVKKHKKEIEQIYKHKENGTALTNDLKNIKLGLQARQNAVDIFKPKHYAQKDLDYANLIKGQNVDNLNIIISDNKNMLNGALGFFDKNTNDIIVYRGERTNKEISETIWHETQHAMDIIKIRNLPDNHPAKVFYENNQKEYSKVAKYLIDKRLKIYRTYVMVYLKRRNLEKLLPLKKNGIIDNPEKYGKMLKEEVNNGKISKDIADFLSKEADALQRYYNDFFEIRAYNAQNKIKNGDIIDELGRHNQENRSRDVQYIRYSRDNEPGHFGLRPIRPHGNPSHSGQFIQTNERKRTDDNSIFGRSKGKTTQELHTQRPTNSSMSFGQLGEPSDKRGKLDNEYGQFGKIQKQPNSGTVEQFSPKLQQNKSKYPRTPKGRRYFMEYGEGDGMPESGVSKEISERRGSSKLDEDGFAKPVQSGEQRLAPTPQSFIKSIRNSSKHQEQIKIDFDIITQDQASNRLKQQSSGEGVYFKQGFGKGDDKIDLTRNYNESRENKVGHFGVKELDGLSKRGSTKEILIETKKEEIKLQHLKDSVNFIEKEFAKPLPASGKASKGYVAVNRNLLANAVYGKKSTAWYETMVQGEEAIKKAYKNEAVAKNWIELANRNSKPDYQLPEQVFNKLFDGSGETVAEYWERYGSNYFSKAVLKTSGAILDAFNNSFKRGVLTSSSFVFNNRFGNQMMIMAKSNPVEYVKSFYQATKLKDHDLPTEVIESSLLEAMNGYNARQTYTGWQPLDNFLNLCGGHLIDTSTLKTMKPAPDNGLNFKVIKGKTVPKKMVETHNAKSLGAEVANVCIGLPNKAFNKVCDKLMKLNEAIENFERKQVYGIKMNRVKKDLVKKTGKNMISQEEFLKHIKEHPELEETMVKSIEDTLGDYNNFNKFEKKVLKRVVPFYSWYRTITRHTLTLAKENPARCAMIFLELERLKDKDEDLKEWQKGSLRTGVMDSRSNKELVVNKTAQIPYSTFKEFVDESGKGGLSPAIKKPIEAVRGKQFFNDSEITSRRYMKHKKGWGDKAKQGYLDKKTGEFKEGDLPLSPRLNYLGKEALETVYPAMRSPLLKPEATIQGLGNLVTNGKYKEPDKLYDADIGGYNKGDKFIGKNKRYASNDVSTTTKMINRVLGFSLQNKQPLNKDEKEALKEKYKRQLKRMYN